MTIEDALSKAADLINGNEEAYKQMVRAREFSDEMFNLNIQGDPIKYRNMLGDQVVYSIENEHKHYSIGYWYGRYTDPRWSNLK